MPHTYMMMKSTFIWIVPRLSPQIPLQCYCSNIIIGLCLGCSDKATAWRSTISWLITQHRLLLHLVFLTTLFYRGWFSFIWVIPKSQFWTQLIHKSPSKNNKKNSCSFSPFFAVLLFFNDTIHIRIYSLEGQSFNCGPAPLWICHWHRAPNRSQTREGIFSCMEVCSCNSSPRSQACVFMLSISVVSFGWCVWDNGTWEAADFPFV